MGRSSRGVSRALVGVCLTLAALLVAACQGGTSTLASTALNVYSWSEYLPPDVISSFEAAHPGLTVNVTTYDSNEEMLAGLAAQPGHYDLVIPSDYAVEILIDQKGLEPIDVGKDLKNFDNILPNFRSPYFDPGGTPSRSGGKGTADKYTVPFQWGTTGIAYDPSKVPFAITSWADLARPELHGKVGVLDDSREVLGAALLATGHDKNDASPESLAQAVAWLQGLGIVSIDSATPEKALEAGTALASIIFNGNAVLATRADPAISYVLPQAGGIFFDNMAIPVGAPHRDAALAFIDHVLDGPQSASISRTYGYSTPNQAALTVLATTDPAFVADPVTDPPADALLDLRLVKNVGTEGQARFEAAWKEIKP